MGKPLDVRRKGSSTVSARAAFTILSNNGFFPLCEETKLVPTPLMREFSALVARSEDGPKATQKAAWRETRNMFRRFGTVLVSLSGDSIYMMNPDTQTLLTVPVTGMVGLGDLARLERESKLNIKAQAASLSFAR